jgi:hypothetical protein
MMRIGRCAGRRILFTSMSRVSLPGLSLSAVVVVAALLALLALETGGREPGQYQPPPESDAIMRLGEARGAVKGREASSEADRRRADQRAASARRAALAAARRTRSADAARADGRSRPPGRAGTGQPSAPAGSSAIAPWAGTVAVNVPDALQVSRTLKARDFIVDYRPPVGVRISPHFYNSMEEIDRIMSEMASIVAKKDYATADAVSRVT